MEPGDCFLSADASERLYASKTTSHRHVDPLVRDPAGRLCFSMGSGQGLSRGGECRRADGPLALGALFRADPFGYSGSLVVDPEATGRSSPTGRHDRRALARGGPDFLQPLSGRAGLPAKPDRRAHGRGGGDHPIRAELRHAGVCGERELLQTLTYPADDDYNDYMITKLRDAKEQLSDLVKRAAGGEEIIITVRGHPAARLSSAHTSSSDRQDQATFAEELSRLAESVCHGSPTSTSQTRWDELREDRI